MRPKRGAVKPKRKAAAGAQAAWLTTTKPGRAKLDPGTMPARAPEGVRRRVWWAPTDDKERSDFGGMFWTATVTKRTKTGFKVVYDNGESDSVDAEDVFLVPPVSFGQETAPLQAGEFCEVSNASKTDPAEWLGVVARPAQAGKYLVTYPFHDTGDELVEARLVRRARIHREGHWHFIRPGQAWEDGDVVSPLELELCTEAELHKAAGAAKAAAAKDAGKGTPAKGKAASRKGKEPGKAAAKGAPARATPAKPPAKPPAKDVPGRSPQTRAGAGATAQPAAPPKPPGNAKKRERGRTKEEAAAEASGSNKRPATSKTTVAAAGADGAAAAAAASGPLLPGAKEIAPGLFLVPPKVPGGTTFLVQAHKGDGALPAGITLPAAAPAAPAAAAPAAAEPAAQARPPPAPAAVPQAGGAAAPAAAAPAAATPAAAPAMAPAEAAAAANAAGGTPGDEPTSHKKQKQPPACAPRAALTGQEAYAARHWQAAAQANPGVGEDELARMLACQWARAGEAERAGAEAEAAADRERYDAEVRAAAAAATPKSRSNFKPKPKDPNAPKKPRTAYILFSMDFRKTLPRNLAFNEGTALAAQAFKAASAAQLAPYHAASEKEKAAYAVVYAAYSAQKSAAEAAARQAAAAALPSVAGAAALPAAAVAVARGPSAAGAPATAVITPGAGGAAPGPSSRLPAAQAMPAAAAAAAVAPSATRAAEVQAALQGLDIGEAEAGLRKAGFQQGAFYKLADALRLHSPVLDDALRAYAWHVRGKGRDANWLGFMITTFGMEACEKLKAAPGGA